MITILKPGCRTFLSILLLVLSYGAMALSATTAAARGAVHAETSDAVPATAAELSALIATLESETARAALVRDLEVMRQVRAGADGAGPSDGSADATGRTSLWDGLRTRVDALWLAATQIDPARVLLRIAMTLAVIGVAWFVYRLAVNGMLRIYGRLQHDDRRDDAVTQRDSATLPPALRRVLVIFVLGIAAFAMAGVWGLDLARLLDSSSGSRFATTLMNLAVIAVLSILAWHAADVLVARALRFQAARIDGARSASRIETLSPLLRKILHLSIAVLGLLLVLSELGVEIGPLLAGAGILGLAIGFGAQSLVKDFVTGFTILLEDAASIGDVVDIGGYSGRIEEMSVRVMTLRDLAGNVHTIPYSEVGVITNMTKLYSYAVLEVGVAYREDTDEVCEELAVIAAELRGEDEFEAVMLEPMEILGVDALGDSAVIVKVRIKTPPGDQWRIAREMNRRIKKRFDAAGIEIPFPHTTLYFGEPKEGRAPPLPVELKENEKAAA